MAVYAWYSGNDIFIRSVPLDRNGDPVTGATATVTIQDLAGNNLVGPTWPVSMSETSAGVYETTFDKADLTVVHGQRFKAVVVLDDGVGGDSQWELHYLVIERTA